MDTFLYEIHTFYISTSSRPIRKFDLELIKCHARQVLYCQFTEGPLLSW